MHSFESMTRFRHVGEIIKIQMSYFIIVGVLLGGFQMCKAMVRQPFQRPVATYSIVARDAKTGDIGVAVQSHWFSVGSVVPWAKAGVGAVATQSLVDPTYGPAGLRLIELGRSAPDALTSMLAGDAGVAVRQVAMIDTAGRVAAYTGANCIGEAGQVVDEEDQFSVQANMMADASVWPAMAQAYRDSKGDLADRMLAALAAAQQAGGDIRGRQSAALIIVSAKSTGKSWLDRKFDLRIEDHPDPIKELARLVKLQRAYQHMNAGDLAMETNDFESASQEYSIAAKLAPQIVEIPFWHATTLASSGQLEKALPIYKMVFEREPVWAELVPRFVKSGLLPDDKKVIAAILSQAKP